ncbi:hypothetical protein K439DRAFT_1640498 [Ramaria rubella]|nr:hypothetical protein K439DRAFT_1640498 [Ramaria rubella]
MRFLAFVSVFFAVTQVAFAAPVFHASDVITCNLQPAQVSISACVGAAGVIVDVANVAPRASLVD